MLVIGRTQIPVTQPRAVSLWVHRLSAFLREPPCSSLRPERSARGSVLPVNLGEASERALPARAVLLALESALLRAEVPHGSVGATHQDLRAKESRMAIKTRLPSLGPQLGTEQLPLT